MLLGKQCHWQRVEEPETKHVRPELGCCHCVRQWCGSLLAQVVALDSRTQRLEADLRAAATREQQLQEELQAAKRAATALQRSPSKIGGERLLLSGVHSRSARANCAPAARCTGNTCQLDPLPMHALCCHFAASNQPAASFKLPTAALPITPRTLSGQFEAAGIPAVPAQAPPSPATSLSLDRTSAVEVLRAAAVQRQLQVVQVPLSASGPSLRIPFSSWLLCESLIGWAKVWGQPEIDAAADILQRAIVEAAAAGGLRAQAGRERAGWEENGVLPGAVCADT